MIHAELEHDSLCLLIEAVQRHAVIAKGRAWAPNISATNRSKWQSTVEKLTKLADYLIKLEKYSTKGKEYEAT